MFTSLQPVTNFLYWSCNHKISIWTMNFPHNQNFMVTLICHPECSRSNTHSLEIFHSPWLELLYKRQRKSKVWKFLGSIYNEIFMIWNTPTYIRIWIVYKCYYDNTSFWYVVTGVECKYVHASLLNRRYHHINVFTAAKVYIWVHLFS